ncbi:hypothetical protein C2E23DRAFT_893370 [Lenzites betulinus]|nr:hypothetical protein C2E23DRAFT_893370 [Lenzites betulinus]
MLIDLPRELARREADSGGKLSKSTIIIIAVVCGSVVLLAFALFIWRNLALSCRRSRNVPLPPVQDLAHHREQQLAAFADRASTHPATWADVPHPRVYSAHFLSATASNSSLIRGSADFTNQSRSPTRENSWAVEDATSAESSPSPYPTPLSADDLRAPNPSYYTVGINPHNSMASVASGSSEGGEALTTSPSEFAPSIESSASLVRNAVAPARPRPPRNSRSRSRPFSVVSSATTHSVQTTHSISAFRGPAHSIHSNIQIVLPAPLAPELYPNANPTDDRISIFGGTARSSSFYGGGGEGDRRSVADPWLTGSQSRTPMRIEREGSGGSGSGSSSARPSNSAGSRPVPALPRSSLSRVASASSLRSANDSASTRAAARARSQPPAGAPSYSLPPSREPSPGPSRPPPMPTNAGPPRSPPPPVPRIPSMYGNPGMPYPAPAGAMQADYGNAHGADPSTYGRGRPVRKPVPVAPSLPAGAAAPWDPLAQNGMAMQPMPVPTPMEYAVRGGGRRDDERRGWAQAGQGMGPGRNGTGTEAFEPRAERRSSKLRKQRSSSRPGQVS